MAANMFYKQDFNIGLPKLDGSSIRGFTEIHESDLIIKPDPSTYAIVPWIEKDPTARLICDVLTGGSIRESFPRDPRGIARRLLNMFMNRAMTLLIGDRRLNFLFLTNSKLIL
ncbi:MAG TPA: glutamine synthetase beta-grasp domain-containing protein [Nitrososphaeraceae archaeon]|nr:glutamine synthetase beta-grasp domain-containing protein [Nitrososphaeraceae archaeon]